MAETLQSELLDVVDIQDRVLEARTRAEVHRLALMHRSVHVLVFDSAGRLLLQKRSILKDECQGLWDSSCAGHVEAGQTYDETAPRELVEELGFTTNQPLKPLFKMPPTKRNGYEFATVYQTVYEGPFSIAADEIDEIQWFSPEQVDHWVSSVSGSVGTLTNGFCEIWLRFRATAI